MPKHHVQAHTSSAIALCSSRWGGGCRDLFLCSLRRLSAFWLGKSPATFYQLYTGAAVVLFATRWLIYKSKK